MGRRKIEIQPIQHDRNRSVTFLKRKNGLFKKAYELGVLCSADVAVIVFGHNSKLYEYCSTDLSALLARQREYTGERDIKGPPDFSGADKNDAGSDSDASVGGGGGGGGGDGPSKPSAPAHKPPAKGKSRAAPAPPSAPPQHQQPPSQGTRYAVPSPLPTSHSHPSEPDSRPPSVLARPLPVKREELPALITSALHPHSGQGMPSSAPGGMGMGMGMGMGGRGEGGWERGAMSAREGAYGGRQQQQQQEWQGGSGGLMGVDKAWDGGGMGASAGSSSSTSLNSFYSPHPHPSQPQPPLPRPLHSLLSPQTPHHTSHPPSVSDILAANPHLAQQLAAAAAHTPGFGGLGHGGGAGGGGGGGGGQHPLYNDPIFNSIFNTSSSSSSSSSSGNLGGGGVGGGGGSEMDWGGGGGGRRGLASAMGQPSLPYTLDRASHSHSHPQPPSSTLSNSYWLDDLWPPSSGDGGGGRARDTYTPDLPPASAFQRASLKRSLTSGTPISPAESGTPREEGGEGEEDADEDGGGEGKRARVR